MWPLTNTHILSAQKTLTFTGLSSTFKSPTFEQPLIVCVLYLLQAGPGPTVPDGRRKSPTTSSIPPWSLYCISCWPPPCPCSCHVTDAQASFEALGCCECFFCATTSGYPLNVPSKKGKLLFFPRILPEGSLHLLPVFSLFSSSSGVSFHHLVS